MAMENENIEEINSMEELRGKIKFLKIKYILFLWK